MAVDSSLVILLIPQRIKMAVFLYCAPNMDDKFSTLTSWKLFHLKTNELQYNTALKRINLHRMPYLFLVIS